MSSVARAAVDVSGSGGVRSHIVAVDKAGVDVVKTDPLLSIAGDHIAAGRACPADGISSAVDRVEPTQRVRGCTRTGVAQSDPVAFDHVVIR